jgi:hypothetical protein
MLAREFIWKWKAVELTERVAAHSYLIDLCHGLHELTPTDADPKGEWYQNRSVIREVEILNRVQFEIHSSDSELRPQGSFGRLTLRFSNWTRFSLSRATTAHSPASPCLSSRAIAVYYGFSVANTTNMLCHAP